MERTLTDPWDEFHPVDGNEPLLDYEEVAPEIPTIDALPEVVDYSVRAPGDWVLSGPLGEARYQGRRFATEIDAYRWACAKYGRDRVRRMRALEFRWMLLIRA